MDLGVILTVLVGVVIFVLLLKLLGKVLSLALSTLGIIILVWVAIAGLRMLDEMNLRENLAASDILFLLEDRGAVLAGFATMSEDPDLAAAEDALLTGDDDYLSRYYKVVKVYRSSLPEKTSLLIDAAGPEEIEGIFRSYADGSFISPDDGADKLIEAEASGAVSVHKETLAFKHGLKEVLLP